MVIRGVLDLLGSNPNIVIVGSDYSSEGIVDRIIKAQADILIYDYQLQGITGAEVYSKVKSAYPAIKGICFTQHCESWIIQQLIKSKINGIVIKSESPQLLIDAIMSVSSGQQYFSPLVNKLVCQTFAQEQNHHLTKREVEVVKLIATGLSSKEIAIEVNLSVNTVEDYRKNVMAKLSVKNVAELIHKTTKMGII